MKKISRPLLLSASLYVASLSSVSELTYAAEIDQSVARELTEVCEAIRDQKFEKYVEKSISLQRRVAAIKEDLPEEAWENAIRKELKDVFDGWRESEGTIRFRQDILVDVCSEPKAGPQFKVIETRRTNEFTTAFLKVTYPDPLTAPIVADSTDRLRRAKQRMLQVELVGAPGKYSINVVKNSAELSSVYDPPILNPDEAKAKILGMLQKNSPYIILNSMYKGAIEGDPHRQKNGFGLAPNILSKGSGELPEWDVLDDNERNEIAKRQIEKLQGFGFDIEVAVGGPNPLFGYASISVPDSWKKRIIHVEENTQPHWETPGNVQWKKVIDVIKIGDNPECKISEIIIGDLKRSGQFSRAVGGDAALVQLTYSYTWDEYMRKFVEAFGGIRNYKQVNIIRNLENVAGLITSKDQIFNVSLRWEPELGWRVASLPQWEGKLKLADLSKELLSGLDAIEQGKRLSARIDNEIDKKKKDSNPLIAEREWIDQKGRKIKASLVEIKGDTCVLLTSGSTRLQVPIKQLSANDQTLIRSKQ